MLEVKSLTYTYVQTAQKCMDQTCQEIGGSKQQANSQQTARPPYVCDTLDNIGMNGEDWTYRDRYSDAIREIYKFCNNALPGICCHGRR